MNAQPPSATSFCFSRDAVEALLSGPEREESEAAFARHGQGVLDRFLRDLAELPQVEDTDLKTDSYRYKDGHGTAFICTMTIKIKFKRVPLIQVGGHGYGDSAREAKLIAMGESLERLGFRLKGWSDSALPAEGKGLPDIRNATENTNGACFHTSPLKALKGAFCELLERDAFLTAWYSGRRLPVSRISRTDGLYPMTRRFAAEGWELREHCWVHDRVHATFVAFSLARNKPIKDQWNFFFGSAAAPNVGEARVKAMREMLKSRRQCSSWGVATTGRVTASHLQFVASRRLLYQRPAFVQKFIERLNPDPHPVPLSRREISDRDFVKQCFRKLSSAKIVPLVLPIPFRDIAFCLLVVCRELQGLDWQIPPRYNVARIQDLYRVLPYSLCDLPHPLA